MYTIEEMAALCLPHSEAIAKNLFLQDDKKRNFYLVTLRGERRADLRRLQQDLGSRKLSFAGGETLSPVSYTHLDVYKRQDLYYALDVLSLSLLPLRRRREDIEGWAERFLEAQQQKQSRYLSLTAGARRALAAYAWEGNLPQLESFCERAVSYTHLSRPRISCAGGRPALPARARAWAAAPPPRPPAP